MGFSVVDHRSYGAFSSIELMRHYILPSSIEVVISELRPGPSLLFWVGIQITQNTEYIRTLEPKVTAMYSRIALDPQIEASNTCPRILTRRRAYSPLAALSPTASDSEAVEGRQRALCLITLSQEYVKSWPQTLNPKLPNP